MKRIISILVLFCSVYHGYAQNKSLALVIGNGNYEHMQLGFTAKNVQEISSKLENLGFTVMSYTDLDQGKLKESIDRFGDELRRYDVALLYYTGLAIQLNGENYLMPVDAKPGSYNDVEYSSVQLGRVLGKMEDAGNATNIIILDAALENNLETKWEKMLAASRGLAFTDAPVGSLIAYSTTPGRLTKITDNGLSLYTSALLKYLEVPNISVEDVFKKVRIQVKEQSHGSQIPWESTSLEGNYYFLKDENFDEMKVNFAHGEYEDKAQSRKAMNTFTDGRDGKEYNFVQIGNQVWMAENLNFEIEDHSWCFDDLDINCSSFGRLYDFAASEIACPDGWHLPSDEEWKILEVFLGMSRSDADKMADVRGTIQGGLLKKADEKMWEPPNNGATNSYNFSAVPGGARDESGTFTWISKYGIYWSSTLNTRVCAWARFFANDMTSIPRYSIIKPYALSIRCVKDDNEFPLAGK